MFNVLTHHFIDFCEYMFFSEFDASNLFQTSWHKGNKRTGRVVDTQKTPVWIGM